MTEMIKVDLETLDDFTDNERWEAEDMVRRFGAEAENMATERMIEVLDEGDVPAIISHLRLRRCIRKINQKEPYMRRLTDKIAAVTTPTPIQAAVPASCIPSEISPAWKA